MVTRSIHWQWSILHRGLLVRCWGRSTKFYARQSPKQRTEVDLCHGEVSEMIVIGQTQTLTAYTCVIQTPEMSLTHESRNNMFQLVISSEKYMYKQNWMKSKSWRFLSSILTTFSNNWSPSRAYWRPYITTTIQASIPKISIIINIPSPNTPHAVSTTINQWFGGVANGSGGWWQWWCCAIKYHTIKSKGDAKPNGRGGGGK